MTSWRTKQAPSVRFHAPNRPFAVTARCSRVLADGRTPRLKKPGKLANSIFFRTQATPAIAVADTNEFANRSKLRWQVANSFSLAAKFPPFFRLHDAAKGATLQRLLRKGDRTLQAMKDEERRLRDAQARKANWQR